jgi:hypothetical protein
LTCKNQGGRLGVLACHMFGTGVHAAIRTVCEALPTHSKLVQVPLQDLFESRCTHVGLLVLIMMAAGGSRCRREAGRAVCYRSTP